MRILDLFSGAGGAAMGYHLAFPDAEIVGVDISPQPRYPFFFVQADATRFPLDGFDLVHASPPCHDHSTVSGQDRKRDGPKGTGWMLAATVDRLLASEARWVVENVEGASMPDAPHAFRLCGSSFLLDLRRHRKFVSNFSVQAPPCAHSWQTPRFRSLRSNLRKEGRLSPVVGVHGHCNYAGEFAIRREAMRISWMSSDELCQAIPPAYTEWIGLQVKEGQ